jgi:hypothetical protein
VIYSQPLQILVQIFVIVKWALKILAQFRQNKNVMPPVKQHLQLIIPIQILVIVIKDMQQLRNKAQTLCVI